LNHSAPFMSSGGAPTIEAVLAFYQRMSALAQAGKMRNAPPEFLSMRLADSDLVPLAAFLRALNEKP
jgi:hypothetical protein